MQPMNRGIHKGCLTCENAKDNFKNCKNVQTMEYHCTNSRKEYWTESEESKEEKLANRNW